MKRRGSLLRTVLIVLLLVMGTAISGCGTTAGPEGPAGPTGPEGPAGEDGNANVVGGLVALTDADWVNGVIAYEDRQGFGSGRVARVVVLDVPEITQEIYDLGMVHVYMKVPDAFGATPAAWAPLPYRYLAFGGAYFFNVAFAFDVGKLTLHYFFTPNGDGSTPSVTEKVIPDKTFKIVIVSARAIGSLASDGVDASDHDAVLRYLAD